MSKSTKLDKTVKRYILRTINATDYGQNIRSTADKIAFLRNTFESEYGWHIKQVGRQQALTAWFAGLPTACTVDFENYEILKLAVKWGSIPASATEAQKDRILDSWFMFIAVKTGQLFDGYRIP